MDGTAGLADHRQRAFRTGVALAITNTVIGASQPALTRWGAVHLDPLAFCTAAVVIAAICSAIAMLWHGELHLLFDARYRTPLALMALVGTVATSLTITFGLAHINAVAGTILLQTEPVYSLILATIVLGERPSHRQLIATATILIGIGSVFRGENAFAPMWAAALVASTPLFWQVSHVMGLRLMPPLSPRNVTAGRMIYAAFVLGALLMATRPATIMEFDSPAAITVVALTGLFVYFVSALTWYGAINRLSLAWTTALVVPGIPLLSIMFAMVFLGESASRRELIGIAIAVVGVLALVLGGGAHRRHPEEMEAAEAIHQPLN